MIDAYNKSGKLLPGMTANVSFVKQKKDNILVVPSAALRFTPTSLSAAEVKKDVFLASLPSDLTEAQRQAAATRYDAAQKAIAAGKTPAGAPGGLSSLMGGARFPGGGFGGQRRPAQATPTAQSGGLSGAAQGAGASAPVAAPKKPLWYMDDSGKLAVVMVGVGMSDGLTSELVGADALEGKKVILKIKAE